MKHYIDISYKNQLLVDSATCDVSAVIAALEDNLAGDSVCGNVSVKAKLSHALETILGNLDVQESKVSTPTLKQLITVMQSGIEPSIQELGDALRAIHLYQKYVPDFYRACNVVF